MDRHSARDHHKHDSAADVNAAHIAWDLWKSNDPRDWDKALDERERINKHNPKAWKKAMHEVDAEEAQHKVAKHHEVVAKPVPKPIEIRSDKPVERIPAVISQDQSGENIVAPGYAPESKFAPPVPDSPAYRAAYERQHPEFYGVDLGIAKLGVNSNGSIETGVNIGIAKAGLQVGLENRVDGEFMPIGGPLHARAGAGVGVNRDGIHSDVGAGANFFNAVNGDADFDARVGRNTGVDGDVRGRVLPVNVQADAGANIGPEGLNAYTGANTDVMDQVGFRTGGDFRLNSQDSGLDAGVGVRAGDNTLDFGPSIYSNGNTTVRPDLHFDRNTDQVPAFYPDGDRGLDGQ
ncbi:MAG: hypothetical protein IPO31_12620 [Candidatus Obscuribacter sp.]|nr:hypothetical protein [Candidatus Obscuribacter sp.]